MVDDATDERGHLVKILALAGKREMNLVLTAVFILFLTPVRPAGLFGTKIQ